MCHVESIDADLTLCGLQDSEQAESHGRLASPSAAHNAYLWGMGKVVRGISRFLSAPQWIEPVRAPMFSPQGMWQGPQSPVPSRLPAHAGSGSSTPTQGPDGTALNSSGTPLPHVWASLLEHGCPLSPRGPSRRQLGSYSLIRVTTPVQSLSHCSAPPFSRHLNPHPPWSLMRRPASLWFSEFLYPLTFFFDGTQGLTRARHTGYHWAMPPAFPL